VTPEFSYLDGPCVQSTPSTRCSNSRIGHYRRRGPARAWSNQWVTETLAVSTNVRGKVLVERGPDERLVLLAFHGYAQSAEDMLEEVRQVDEARRWTIASVQALHRFYSRGRRSAPTDERVVASWMTREDREHAIEDNVAYVDRVVDALSIRPERIACIGFSQGASMAYRAAALGCHRVDAVIALGGDLPPELAVRHDLSWPPVLIGAGASDPWFTSERVSRDAAALASAGAVCEVCRFDGGHEWTDAFRAAASAFLARVRP
jgi:predicted esterase